MFSLKLYAIILAIFPIYGIQSQTVTTPSGVTYYLNKGPNFAWHDAYLECSYRNMELLTVDSKKQYDEILALVGPTEPLWVGAIGIGNKFVWLSTGSSVKPDLWSTQYKNGASTDNCIHFCDGYGMNVVPCSEFKGYVCEKRVQPGDCCAKESTITLNVAQSNTCTK